MINVSVSADKHGKMELSGRSMDLLLEFVILNIDLTLELTKLFNLDSVSLYKSLSELVIEKLIEPKE